MMDLEIVYEQQIKQEQMTDIDFYVLEVEQQEQMDLQLLREYEASLNSLYSDDLLENDIRLMRTQDYLINLAINKY